MTIYPDSKKPRITQLANFSEDGYRLKEIQLNTHHGTHIDSPAHMIEDGKSLDQLPVEKFYGTGMVIDCTSLKSNQIPWDFLEQFQEKINKIEFLLLYTGFDRFWGKPEYLNQWPTITPQAAQEISNFPLKGFGVDNISVDPKDSPDGYPVHKALLLNNYIILENLTNLKPLLNQEFYLSCFPLNIPNLDGCSTRVMATIIDE